MMMPHKDWVEITIYRIEDEEDWPRFLLLDTREYAERVGRVYERRHHTMALPTLARERVLKHSRVTPGRTYIAMIDGIGEVARATSKA